MNLTTQNPWQREGVSILPKDLTDLMPIVGQEKLFRSLCTFRDRILDPGSDKLTGFFMVIGGWGVGKSRVGHEVCLQAFSENVQWIVNGSPNRIMAAGLKEGILPLFVRYIQVTKGPLGDHLEADNWIPSVTLEALARLVELRETDSANRFAKNQDRILELARKALKPRGWDRELSRLKQALQEPNPSTAVRNAIVILKDLGINQLWLVVDEIEDITDVEQDGLSPRDRTGIDQALLTIIPRVIKAEESRQAFPEVNLLLLCAQSVGDLLKQIRAIERRTGWHELVSNTFGDVEAFFQYLTTHRPKVAEAVAHYPSGLKEAAFFAANRNFGWFNVIMHHAHQNHRQGNLDTPGLLKKFAEDSATGHEKSVFNLDTISEFHIPRDTDYGDIERAMFSLIPRPIGSTEGVSAERAGQLLAKRDHGGQKGALFIRLREIAPPPKHRILAYMINCGFKNPNGNELTLPGMVSFDLGAVVESLKAYSIGLPEERRENFLICEDEREFTEQIKGLSPYPEQADHFAGFLHGLFMDPALQVKNGRGDTRMHIGPAFSFLLQFNSLNQTRRAEEGFLRDGAKNTHLEEAFREVQKDPAKRTKSLLRGLANAWDMEQAPVALTEVSGMKLPVYKWVPQLAPLNLGLNGEATLVYAAKSPEADLEEDLTRLAQGPAAPVLLILEDQDQLVEDLRQRLDRNVPGIAPFVIIHNLTRPMPLHLVRLGLMGEAFQPNDLRTSHFHAIIGTAKEHLASILDLWCKKEQIETQGLLLKPLFYATRITDDELQAFAKGYAAMLSGIGEHDVVQAASGVFSDSNERDRFKKMIDLNFEPGPKYQDKPRMELTVRDATGLRIPHVPRSLISVLNECAHVPVSRSIIEQRFLFELAEGVKTRDVVRHLTALLHHMGVAELEGDKLQRTSAYNLEIWVKRAKDWLDGEFKTGSELIRGIHREAGEELLSIKAKEARDVLKQAEQKLGALTLDFITKPWSELNKDDQAGAPVYEESFRAAIRTIREVRQAVQRVYDPAAMNAFRYSHDSLREFEANEKSPGYPLWKRLAVLQGFYDVLDKKRKELTKRIDSVCAEVDVRVPDLHSGEKAFPIQPLTLPLNLYRQELNFAADKPEKTVAAGGSSAGVKTVGFKIASGHYLEALERLESLDQELNQPGKMVARFYELLHTWEGLRSKVSEVKIEALHLVDFFSDAPRKVREAHDLQSIQENLQDLVEVIEEGGIRVGTDNREAAGAPAPQLLSGLEEDLLKVKDIPRQVEQQLQSIMDGVVPTLRELYHNKHRYRINAVQRIRAVQGKSPLDLPSRLDETYGKTVEAFDTVVEQMEKEGAEFFAGCKETSFNVFVSYCQLDIEGKPVNWYNAEHQRHMNELIDKKLLTLKLINP
jgi:hypothetical protein